MKKIILILILIFNLNPCFANEIKKINLIEAMDIAIQNNLDIKTHQINVNISKNDIEISNKLQNPTIKTFWNFGEAGKGNANQLGLSQTIELFKRGTRKELAKSNYKLAEDEYNYQLFNLKMDVAEAYIKLVVAKSILKKYEHQKDFLEKLLKISEINNKKNGKLDLDTFEAKIALNQILTEVNKAKTDEKIARIGFNKAINSIDSNYDSSDDILTKTGNIIGIKIPKVSDGLPSFSKIEDFALKNRLDIKIAKNEIDISQKNLKVISHQRIPDIEVSSGYGYQPIGLSDSTFLSGAYLEGNLVNIPLLYSYKPEIRNAQLEIEKSKINYISTINKAKKSILIAYEKFVTAQINLERYNDNILKDSEELFELFEKTYKTEQSDFAALAAVEESYQDLVEGYSETLSDYYISWINLLREMNSENFEFDMEKL
jgi:cobalt-zinc-cadmium efflux system outer membrane protein